VTFTTDIIDFDDLEPDCPRLDEGDRERETLEGDFFPFRRFRELPRLFFEEEVFGEGEPETNEIWDSFKGWGFDLSETVAFFLDLTWLELEFFWASGTSFR